MKVRIVDYVANLGGGVRFSGELLRELRTRGDLAFEVVSHGAALDRYRGLLGTDPDLAFVDVPPRHAWRHRTLLAGIPGAGPLNLVLGTPDFKFDVPRRALEGCDVAWFPWLHRHRLPWDLADRAVGSLHDVIIIDHPAWFHPSWSRSERGTISGWLGSRARIAVSSNATAASLARIFGAVPGRVAVIPLSGQHGSPPEPVRPPKWPFANTPYLLCPANLSRHKNHEVLLAGVAGFADRHPLVLTGEGTDLAGSLAPRAAEIRAVARTAGLVEGRSLFALGYLDDPTYYRILDGAWALVMPTLAEGGGSFPVWEAMEHGIPVVSSDIPVMREMVARTGGEVTWFDPRRPESLAESLAELERNYEAYRARARAQAGRLHARTWKDVAQEYAELMGLPDRTEERG